MSSSSSSVGRESFQIDYADIESLGDYMWVEWSERWRGAARLGRHFTVATTPPALHFENQITSGVRPSHDDLADS